MLSVVRMGILLILSIFLMGVIATPAHPAGVMDYAQQKQPVIVNNIHDTVQGFLVEEIINKQKHYYICANPNSCVYLGTLIDLGMTYTDDSKSSGKQTAEDKAAQFFPKHMQYVSIMGNWNIYSNNSVSLDLTKPYDMWSRAGNYNAVTSSWLSTFEPIKE